VRVRPRRPILAEFGFAASLLLRFVLVGRDGSRLDASRLSRVLAIQWAEQERIGIEKGGSGDV